MRPFIESTKFGSISIGGENIEHDVFISLRGMVKKRKKKLSKAVIGTSHLISKAEIKHIYEKGAEGILIGTGQYGVSELSNEAVDYLSLRECKAILYPTPEAISKWNHTHGNWIGLFHITC